MSGREAAILSERAVIEVAGPQARDFLQGLVTVDLDRLEQGSACNGALLTPQGKILFEFMLFDGGPERILLDVRAEAAGELAGRLAFYKLRAKLTIAEAPALAVIALWGEGATPEGIAAPDPRLAALGDRLIAPREGLEEALERAGISLVTAEAYHARRIAHGIPEFIADYPPGDVFPHEADLDQLHGVDFDKGCFVGQEVVSRMQHRGTARKRFIAVGIDGPPPAPGAAVTAGSGTIGTMGSSIDGRGLALLRLDRVGDAQAQDQPIRSEDAVLTPHAPAWARFPIPGASA